MKQRVILVLAVLAALTACEDLTPPIRDPVAHDLDLVTTSFTDDFDAAGHKPTYQRHDTSSQILVIDLKTWGARFDSYGPCAVKDGRVAVGTESVHGKFEDNDGGPRFTMDGTLDSSGVMVGTWFCQTRTLGPHNQSYAGTFVLRRRPG